jgi:hypothetical protein
MVLATLVSLFHASQFSLVYDVSILKNNCCPTPPPPLSTGGVLLFLLSSRD